MKFNKQLRIAPIVTLLALQGCANRPEATAAFSWQEKRIAHPKENVITSAEVGQDIAYFSQYFGLLHYKAKQPESLSFKMFMIGYTANINPTDSFTETILDGRQAICSTQMIYRDFTGMPNSYLCLLGDLKAARFDEVSLKPGAVRLYSKLEKPLDMELTERKMSLSGVTEVVVKLEEITKNSILLEARIKSENKTESKIHRINIGPTPIQSSVQGMELFITEVTPKQITYKIQSYPSPDTPAGTILCDVGLTLKYEMTASKCLSIGGRPTVR